MSVFFVFAVPVGPPHDGRGRSELDRVDCGVETTIRVDEIIEFIKSILSKPLK